MFIELKLLGSIVFSDRSKLELLNSLTHPAVRDAYREWLLQQNVECAAVIIPLLYEVGECEVWDSTVCVGCSSGEQLKRLMARGLSKSDVLARIEAQMPLSEKVGKADFVIWNDGEMSLLEEQARMVLDHIIGR